MSSGRVDSSLPEALEDELADHLFRSDRPSSNLVRELMQRHPEHADTIRRRAADVGLVIPSELPERVGPYRVIDELGRGGFGVVYLGEDQLGSRRVAIKVLRGELQSDEVRRRFRNEAETLACLDHPYVATVHDAGIDHDGQAYFAMEYVDGAPIHTYCDERGLSLRERVALMIRCCRGVVHAHQRLVLHRDITPRNVLVHEQDGVATPKLIDFGLARSLAPVPSAEQAVAEQGRRLGTVPYMAPEVEVPGEVLGPAERPDSRVDVYGLGAVLFELLTGDAPPAAARVVGEPGVLSRAFEAARARGARIHREFEWITLAAMQPRPEQRYASAHDLARDLERALAHQPVEVAHAGGPYIARKFVRRHLTAVLVALVVTVLLVTSSIVSTVAFGRAQESAENAERLVEFLSEQARVDPSRLGEQLSRATRARLDQLTEEGLPAELVEALDGLSFVGIGADAISRVVEDGTLAKIEEGFADRPLLQAELNFIYSQVLHSQSRIEPALALARKAHATRTTILGREDESSLDIAGWIGTLQIQRGEASKAHDWLETSLAASMELLGEDAACTIRIRCKLGSSLRAQGRCDEAEVHHQRAVEQARRVLGDASYDTIACIRNLGYTLTMAQKSERAEEVTRLGLRLADDVLGPSSELAIDLRVSLVKLLRRMGDLEGADAAAREAEELSARALGDRHPVTLRAMHEHAGLLIDQGFPEEAVSILERVSTAREEVFGLGARATTTARCLLVHALMESQRLDEAVAVGERALADAERELPESNRARVNARLVLAEAYEARGDLERARGLLAEVLVHVAGFAENHPVRVAAVEAQQRLGGPPGLP